MLIKPALQRVLLSAALLLIASAAIITVSWDSTTGRFYLDSEGHFRSISYFRDPSLSWEKIHDAIFDNPYPAAKRPIPTISFLIENNAVGLSPKSGRIINLLIHCLNIILLFFLCRHLLIHFGKSQHTADYAALLCALLWGLNPFHADTVFYVIQRMTTLSATFYLLGVIAYLHTRKLPHNWVWWGALAICFSAGLASKENIVLLPLGLLALEFVLPPDHIGGTQARKKRLAWLLGAVLILPSLGAIALGYSPTDIAQELLKDSSRRIFSNTERLLTQGRVLIHYLSLLFFPHPDRLAFVLKYPVSHTLFSPISTLFSWGGIALLLVTSSLYIRRYPLMWLAIFWFFINHLLESTFIQLEMAFVHRNYLPSIFLFLPIACWLVQYKKPQLTVIAPTIILLGLFLSSWNSRAIVWGDPIKFWQDSVEKAPGSLRSYINLGVIWDVKNQPAKAMKVFQQGAKSAYDENHMAWASLYCNMGIASMHLEQYGPAQFYMNKSLSFASMPDCLINMAKLQLKLNNPGMAMQLMNKLAKTMPRHRKLHLMKARAYLAVGQITAARMELVQELNIFPQNLEAKNLLEILNRPTPAR